MRIHAFALLLCFAVLCGCGRRSAPVEPTDPLPPRLLQPVDAATKRPAADALATPERIAEHDFREGLGPWRPIGATVRPFDGGIELTHDGTGVFGIELSGLDWNAAEVQLVGLSARFRGEGWMFLHFAKPGDPEGPTFVPDQAVLETTQKTGKARPYAFVTTSHPTFTGRIERIGFEFDPALGAVRLESFHAVAQPLLPGASPRLEADRLVDGGLVQQTRRSEDLMATRVQSRRAVPARAERFAVCLFQAGAGERLSFSFALHPHLRHLTGPVTFRLFATPAQGREPGRRDEPLFQRALDPTRDGGRWEHGEAELPDTGGEEYELWLETSGGGEPGALVGLWGPLLAGAVDHEPEPSFLLITADTLRADHVGFLRAGRGLRGLPGLVTPSLDALFARGAVFTDTLSTCNSTSPSHASILTSLQVKEHRVMTNELLLPEAHTTLGEVLSDSGRFGIGAVTALHLNSARSGLGQGLHIYLESPSVTDLAERTAVAGPAEIPAPSPQTVLFATAAYQTPALLSVIDELDGAPFHAWLHAFDAHTPYVPRPDVLAGLELPADEGERALIAELAERYFELSGVERPADDGAALTEYLYAEPALHFLGDARSAEFARSLYAAGVSQLDGDLGRLFDELERRGRLADTLIAFTADHGEALGERDVWFGHEGLFDNTLQVPLAFAGPGVPSGVVSNAPASTLDLVPTVCELLGVAKPANARGLSLVPRFAEAGEPDRQRWFEYASGFAVGYASGGDHVFLNAADHPRGSFGAVAPRGTIERYRRAPDGTLAERNTVDELGARLEPLREELRSWLLRRDLDLGPAGKAKLSGTDQAVLERLGYVQR